MLKINDRVDGNGPAVILAHGWAASLRDWDAQFPALVSAGYRVYALDQLGHGESEKPGAASDYTITNAYDAFCEWVDSLTLNQPFGLIGHSMGGYISLRYTSEHPERVRCLELIDPLVASGQMTLPLSLIFSQPKLLASILRITPIQWFEALYRFSPRRKIDLATRLTIARDYKVASPSIAYLLHQLPSLTERLRQITAPTLLIYGKHDLSLKPRLFPFLGRQIPGLAGLHGLAAGHTPHVDRPEWVNHDLLAFLNQYLKCP